MSRSVEKYAISEGSKAVLVSAQVGCIAVWWVGL
jgi:hypothetical protein